MVNVAPPSVLHAGLASDALLGIRLNVHSLYSLLKVRSDKRTPCNCPVEWSSIRAPFRSYTRMQQGERRCWVAGSRAYGGLLMQVLCLQFQDCCGSSHPCTAASAPGACCLTGPSHQPADRSTNDHCHATLERCFCIGCTLPGKPLSSACSEQYK